MYYYTNATDLKVNEGQTEIFQPQSLSKQSKYIDSWELGDKNVKWYFYKMNSHHKQTLETFPNLMVRV